MENLLNRVSAKDIEDFLGRYKVVEGSVRSLINDFENNDGVYSDFSRFSVERLLKSELLFKALNNFSEHFLNSSPKSRSGCFELFGPALLGSLIGSFYLIRKSIFNLPQDMRVSFLNWSGKFVYISSIFGKVFREVGLTHGIVFGGAIACSVGNFIAKFEKGVDYFKHLNILGSPFDFNYEKSNFGLSSAEMAAISLFYLGFSQGWVEGLAFCDKTLAEESNSLDHSSRFGVIAYWSKILFEKNPRELLLAKYFSETDDSIIESLITDIIEVKQGTVDFWFLPEGSSDISEVSEFSDESP